MRAIRTTGAAALAAAGLMVLGGCGDHASSRTSGEDASAPSDAVAVAGAAPGHGAANGPAQDSAYRKESAGPTGPQVPRAVVQTADVEVSSADVAAAAADVRSLVRKHGGRVDDEQTSTGGEREGVVRRDELTLRVPSGRFATVYGALARVGRLVHASRSREDVTTQTIDVGVRVRAQRASLRRVQALLARASTIEQVLAIEGQMTRRQEQLDSLEQQQSYLADQTSLSTITVVITRLDPAAAPSTHRTGFLGGLQRGWHGLTSAAGALATGVGMALPFGVPALLLGVPTWWALRRRRRVAVSGG